MQTTVLVRAVQCHGVMLWCYPVPWHHGRCSHSHTVFSVVGQSRVIPPALPRVLPRCLHPLQLRLHGVDVRLAPLQFRVRVFLACHRRLQLLLQCVHRVGAALRCCLLPTVKLFHHPRLELYNRPPEGSEFGILAR